MIAAQRLRSCAVTSDHRIEYRNVLAQDRLCHLDIVAQHLTHEAAHIGPVRSGGLTDQGIAGELVDKGVKAYVRFDLVVQRTALNRGPPCVEIGSTFEPRSLLAALGGKTCGQSIQHGPNLVEVSDKVDVERRDNQSPA